MIYQEDDLLDLLYMTFSFVFVTFPYGVLPFYFDILSKQYFALLNLSSWCLVMAERLFLAVPRGSLQFVIVVFPDHTHLLFLPYNLFKEKLTELIELSFNRVF